jgi:5-methylcytosine-specific restriction endonuclease McrA
MANFSKDSGTKSGFRSRCKGCAGKDWKSYASRNSEKLAERDREWYANNSERKRAFAADWRKENPGYKKKWREENPDKYRQHRALRRAREINQVGYVPSGTYGAIFKAYPYCLYPGCKSNEALQVDHVISLADGGLHDISNLQVLCAYHNMSKGAKSIDYRNGEIVIGIDEDGRAVV